MLRQPSPTSRVPRPRFSPALANTRPPSPAAQARTPPKPHRESPAHSVCHSRNSALHTRTLPLRPIILRNSATSASRRPPLSLVPPNNHPQTPPPPLSPLLCAQISTNHRPMLPFADI